VSTFFEVTFVRVTHVLEFRIQTRKLTLPSPSFFANDKVTTNPKTNTFTAEFFDPIETRRFSDVIPPNSVVLS
jgi:hypothetical protein